MNTTTDLPTGTWKIDPATTKVTVSVKKMGFLNVAADLKVTDGTIKVGANGQVEVQVAVDAASYSTGNNKRDEHVATADFLDVASHPAITFTAGPVTAGSNPQIAGEVTVKGKAAPLTFAVSDLSTSADSASFKATSSVDRHALGVTKLPNLVIAKSLELALSVTANRSAS